MVTFLPTRPGRLADVPSFERAIGGAESNVLCALAATGHTTRWVSRVGADGFGDHLLETIAAHGVDVTSVGRDPARPTGIYFRTAADRATDAHEVAYYRSGSAASAMTTDNTDLPAARAARVLHLSGITAALSPSCLSLLQDLTAPHPARPFISFDVNHRPGLWPHKNAPQVLLDLARRADLVFVGEDEAEETWGITGGPEAIRAALPEPTTLVVKQGAQGATLFERQPRTNDSERVTGAVQAPTAGQPHAHEPAHVTGAAQAPVAGQLGTDESAQVRVATQAPAAGVSRADVRGCVGGCPPAAVGASTGPASRETDSAPFRGRTPPGAPPTHPHTPGARPAPEGTAGPDTTTFVPSPHVTVVSPIGAGDAFAAGFLSATLRGLPPKARLRHGHLMAAAALTTPGDLGIPPTRHHADHLAALDDDTWGRLRLAPGWTQAPDGADEEVRTT
ncbi:PfkB family carbohydrate kinase [Streptomyces neyagawaensis]